MRSTFIATVARDGELKISGGGKPYMNVSVWEYTGDKLPDGKKETQFIGLTIFGKQAEGLHQYMTKGRQFVFHTEGLKVETFERRDGSSGASLKGRVVAVDFVNSNDGQQQSQQQQTQTRQRNQVNSVDDLDDDIPF